MQTVDGREDPDSAAAVQLKSDELFPALAPAASKNNNKAVPGAWGRGASALVKQAPSAPQIAPVPEKAKGKGRGKLPAASAAGVALSDNGATQNNEENSLAPVDEMVESRSEEVAQAEKAPELEVVEQERKEPYLASHPAPAKAEGNSVDAAQVTTTPPRAETRSPEPKEEDATPVFKVSEESFPGLGVAPTKSTKPLAGAWGQGIKSTIKEPPAAEKGKGKGKATEPLMERARVQDKSDEKSEEKGAENISLDSTQEEDHGGAEEDMSTSQQCTETELFKPEDTKDDEVEIGEDEFKGPNEDEAGGQEDGEAGDEAEDEMTEQQAAAEGEHKDEPTPAPKVRLAGAWGKGASDLVKQAPIARDGLSPEKVKGKGRGKVKTDTAAAGVSQTDGSATHIQEEEEVGKTADSSGGSDAAQEPAKLEVVEQECKDESTEPQYPSSKPSSEKDGQSVETAAVSTGPPAETRSPEQEDEKTPAFKVSEESFPGLGAAPKQSKPLAGAWGRGLKSTVKEPPAEKAKGKGKSTNEAKSDDKSEEKAVENREEDQAGVEDDDQRPEAEANKQEDAEDDEAETCEEEPKGLDESKADVEASEEEEEGEEVEEGQPEKDEEAGQGVEQSYENESKYDEEDEQISVSRMWKMRCLAGGAWSKGAGLEKPDKDGQGGKLPAAGISQADDDTAQNFEEEDNSTVTVDKTAESSPEATEEPEVVEQEDSKDEIAAKPDSRSAEKVEDAAPVIEVSEQSFPGLGPAPKKASKPLAGAWGQGLKSTVKEPPAEKAKGKGKTSEARAETPVVEHSHVREKSDEKVEEKGGENISLDSTHEGDHAGAEEDMSTDQQGTENEPSKQEDTKDDEAETFEEDLKEEVDISEEVAADYQEGEPEEEDEADVAEEDEELQAEEVEAEEDDEEDALGAGADAAAEEDLQQEQPSQMADEPSDEGLDQEQPEEEEEEEEEVDEEEVPTKEDERTYAEDPDQNKESFHMPEVGSHEELNFIPVSRMWRMRRLAGPTPEELLPLSVSKDFEVKDSPEPARPSATPTSIPEHRSLFGTNMVRGDRNQNRDRGGKRDRRGDFEQGPELAPASENAYRRPAAGMMLREEELKRCVQSLLNKICPENVEKIAERLKVEAHVQNDKELDLLIGQIFRKALAEPHYCETYADLVHHLQHEMPQFPREDGKGKPVTFRSSLLNVCQDEFERMPKTMEVTQEEMEKLDIIEQEDLKTSRKKKYLALMLLIGQLYLRHLLSTRVIAGIMDDLSDKNSIPEEHILECICELLVAIGYTLEQSEAGKTIIQGVCARMQDLKSKTRSNGRPLYGKRLQFLIENVLETRNLGWQRKTFKSAAKTKEEVRIDQERDLKAQEQGKTVTGAAVVVAGQKPVYLDGGTASSTPLAMTRLRPASKMS